MSPGQWALSRVGIGNATSGVVRLPNGRGLLPMGEQLSLGDPGRGGGGQNPMAVALSPDESWFATTDFGVNVRSISIGTTAPLARKAWLKAPSAEGYAGYLRGVQFAADGKTLYAANAGTDAIDVFAQQDDGTWQVARSIALQGHHPSDLVLLADGARVAVALAISNEIHLYDTASGALVARTTSDGTFPIALAVGGGRLFAANEGPDTKGFFRVKVLGVDALAPLGVVVAHKNPSALAVSPDGGTLFIAASDDDLIDRYDLVNDAPLEPLVLTAPRPPWLRALQPGASELAVAPTALAISPDGGTLYVTSMMLDAVLVLDAATGALRGALPTGFRPMDVKLSKDGAHLYVVNSEGAGTRPEAAASTGDNSDLARGSLERIAIPSGEALAAATEQVAFLNALPEEEWQPPDPRCGRIGPLPAQRGGDPALSKIGHVVYVLKENKTFDSVFGDFPDSEASAAYLMFGELYTPNQHKLAREYCLLDNFYAESEQSLEGHFWNTAEVTTDYFQRVWPEAWGANIKTGVLPQGGLGGLDSPRAGFIWDALARGGVPYRSYGEFVGIGGDLSRHIDLNYVNTPQNYLARPDTEKLKVFLAALDAGKLEPFTFIALQYDHTFGAQAGMPAPDYMVADNDRATGLLLEKLSQSPFWDDMLVLITEDDPSGAGDHVDSHRSFALLAGPWVKQ
ncbi:MAG: bifunctional YncE family protein/alkaline phosphatase family protein, partial [Deltaproteobacteria bacterium]|nr:bifunctional YncE family protein/alkaline phosphatase family protein [Deltaproteobacteria bacterium]